MTRITFDSPKNTNLVRRMFISMRKVRSSLVSLVMVFATLALIPSSVATAKNPSTLTFASYNVCMTEPWCSNMNGAPSLKNRTRDLYARVRVLNADVLAIQEGAGLFDGVKDLKYTAAGSPAPVMNNATIDNGLGQASKYFTAANVGKSFSTGFKPGDHKSGIGIYVNTQKLDFVRTGSGAVDTRTVRIGTDPEVKATKALERKTPRYAIFVQVRDKTTGRHFWVGNTHLSDGNNTEEKAARVNQLKALNSTLKGFGSTPVVLLGDVNEARTTSSDRLLTELKKSSSAWFDSQDKAATKLRVGFNSYQKWKKTPSKSSSKVGNHIDRVLFSGGGWNVKHWSTSASTNGGMFVTLASDHLPVVVTADLGETPLPRPGSVKAKSVSHSHVTLSWAGVANAKQYRVVFRKKSAKSSSTRLVSGTSYSLTGLSIGTDYVYTVSALSSSGVEGVRTGLLSFKTTKPKPKVTKVVTSAPKKVKRSKKPQIKVWVKSGNNRVSTGGTVEVFRGKKKLKTQKFTTAQKGYVIVTLPKQSKGSKTFTVKFKANSSYKASSGKRKIKFT